MDDRTLPDALSHFQNSAVSAYVENWQGYWKFVAEIVQRPQSVPSAYSRLANVALNSYGSVLDASVQLTQSFFNSLEHVNTTGSATSAGNGTASHARPMQELLFEGTDGETVARHFVVANKSTQPFDVAFEMSPFTADGTHTIPVTVELIPDKFALQPGEEKTVECRVSIINLLEMDRDYRAALRATGLPAMRVALVARRSGTLQQDA